MPTNRDSYGAREIAEAAALAKRAGLPRYMTDTDAAVLALCRFVELCRGPVEQGWKLMPPEPTPEMLDADYKAACWYVIGDGVPQELKDHDHGQALVCYRAVFAAAPSPSATPSKSATDTFNGDTV